MKDRLGNELNIGDLCVCYNNMRTGSSTIRLVQYEGEIVGFTSNQVKVKCVQCSYSEKIGREFTCCPDNIFSIEPKRKGWISVKDGLPDDGYGSVMVVANGGYKNITLIDAIMLAEYNREEGWILDLYPEWETPDVTHWMPLPEPPTE